MRNHFHLLVLALLSHLYLGNGPPVPGVNYDTVPKPLRYRKRPEYNCTELFSVDETEVGRIHERLEKLQEKKFDLVILNYTVKLDCLGDADMKYVRHFIVTSKGKNGLRYAVEGEYFPLKVFGIKSTIQNVNVTPIARNSSSNTGSHPYSLSNLTYISRHLISETRFTDVCVSSREEDEWYIGMYLFIPRPAIFYKNKIICSQTEDDKSFLDASWLVFATYGLCFYLCMHVNLIHDLVMEEIKERQYGREVYHKDETPFSFTRFVLWFSTLVKKAENKPDHKKDVSVALSIAVSILVGLVFHTKFIHGPTWQRHVVFMNDDSTFDYIIKTYEPVIICIFCFLIRIVFYLYSFLFFGQIFVFFQFYEPNSILFSLFKPKNVFTYKLDYLERRNRAGISKLTQFALSYSLLFSCKFWTQLVKLSLDVPNSAFWALRTDDRLRNKWAKCSKPIYYCLFTILAVIEKTFLFTCALINLIINVSFAFLQTLCPVLKYFFSGYASRLHCKKDVFERLAYCVYGAVAYLIIWCAANLYIFNTISFVSAYLLYITVVAIPFNPTYAVPLMVIVLSLVFYLLMFYEDFQSDYKNLLDIIFEILDDHFVKKDLEIDNLHEETFDLKVSNKVRMINMKLFDSLRKKYILFPRKCAFLFMKVTFTGACVVIAFNALDESGTGIDTLKFSDLFSVILLVMIPGILRYFTGPRENLRRKYLYFKVFKYLKNLDRKNELEKLVTWKDYDSDSDTSESD